MVTYLQFRCDVEAGCVRFSWLNLPPRKVAFKFVDLGCTLHVRPPFAYCRFVEHFDAVPHGRMLVDMLNVAIAVVGRDRD